MAFRGRGKIEGQNTELKENSMIGIPKVISEMYVGATRPGNPLLIVCRSTPRHRPSTSNLHDEK